MGASKADPTTTDPTPHSRPSNKPNHPHIPFRAINFSIPRPFRVLGAKVCKIGVRRGTPQHVNSGRKKKPIKRKHINIFLRALVGQSSQGRSPTCPRDKRDKMAILLWNSTEKGRFVPETGPNLSRGGVPFVPGTPSRPKSLSAENSLINLVRRCPLN